MTAKKTRTKVTVRSGRDASSTQPSTPPGVLARGLYDKTHHRDLQLGDDVDSYIDEALLRRHAKQTQGQVVRLTNRLR